MAGRFPLTNMATIQNTDLMQEILKGAKINIAKDGTPSQLAAQVVPVMEVNPRLLRTMTLLKTSSFNNNTTGTIFTTDANNDTYIVAAQLAYIKDATSTATRMAVNAIVDGQGGTAIALARAVGLTLTPAVDNVVVTFPLPIKLTRNTAVTITSDTATGNVTVGGSVFGYIVNNTNA